MKTKNLSPYRFVKGVSIEKVLILYFEANHLKKLYRQGWLLEGRDVPERECESVADHTFGLLILAMLICDAYFPEADLLKVLRMCIIHDLPEVIAGDVRTPEDPLGKLKKHEKELSALKRLLREYPGGDKYLDLWEEFESNDTLEAKLVKQLDKLETAIQAKIYSLEHSFEVEDFMISASDAIDSAELRILLAEVRSL